MMKQSLKRRVKLRENMTKKLMPQEPSGRVTFSRQWTKPEAYLLFFQLLCSFCNITFLIFFHNKLPFCSTSVIFISKRILSWNKY